MDAVPIYVLANDAVYNWLEAFLRSVKIHMPKARINLIPFNENHQRVSALILKNDGRIHNSIHYAELDTLGNLLEVGRSTQSAHWFRRFSAFLDEDQAFAYFDARLLVLTDLTECFNLVSSNHVDFIHFGGNPNQVYQAGPIRQSFATAGRCFGFNSGCWISRGGLITIQDIRDAVNFGREHRSQMNPRNTDQFVLNLILSRSNLRVINSADIFSEFVRDPWARNFSKVYLKSDNWHSWMHGQHEHAKILPIVHWGGIKLNPCMPLRTLWLRYRHPNHSFFRITIDIVSRIPGYITKTLRTSFWIRKFINPRNAGL